MPEQLIFTEFLNHYFGGLTTAILHALGFHPTYPNAPITNTIAMEILATVLLILFFAAVRSTVSLEKPGGLQHTAEMVEEFVSEQADGIIGHGYERYLPYAITIGFFILVSNLLGLIPGFESPTGNAAVPLGCAVLTFLYYHYHGIRVHRFGYIKQFVGPVWPLWPLMFVIEVVSHMARILSL